MEELELILSNNPVFLVFGSHGSIGSSCVTKLNTFGRVIEGSRNLDTLTKQLDDNEVVTGVVWAQGLNDSSSILNFDKQAFQDILQGNLVFILESLSLLTSKGKLQAGSNLVFVSSIWSQLSRPDKLNYGISKAAVAGLMKSAAADLGPLGVSVNSIAPGPIDSQMTRNQLSADQLTRITTETPLKRLVTIDEVSNVITKFATGQMSGITGQEVVVDGGWGVTKLV